MRGCALNAVPAGCVSRQTFGRMRAVAILATSDEGISRTSHGGTDNSLRRRCGLRADDGHLEPVAGEVFLDWLAPARGLRWIDVGCGNGAFTELLVERCAPAEVQGIDPSEGQLAFARTRPRARGAVPPGRRHGAAFPRERFEAAAMALVLVFVPDPAKGVAEMMRVVRRAARSPPTCGTCRRRISHRSVHRRDARDGCPAAAPAAVGGLAPGGLTGLWAGPVSRHGDAGNHRAPDLRRFDEFWRIKLTAPTLGPPVGAMAPAEAEALKARACETARTPTAGSPMGPPPTPSRGGGRDKGRCRVRIVSPGEKRPGQQRLLLPTRCVVLNSRLQSVRRHGQDGRR